MRCVAGHWEKLQINTVTGKENWWQYVHSSTDSSTQTKIPLRRRYPPDCVKCGQAVLVEDDVFSRYGVEWQPLCLKCYATGSGVPLLNVSIQDKDLPYCYWCHEVVGVKDNFCEKCLEYVARVQRDFGLNKNDAYTNLYHFTSNLRKQRKIEPSKQ